MDRSSRQAALRTFFHGRISTQPAPPLAASIQLQAPNEDPTENTALHVLTPGEVEITEGQSFVLNYRDSAGQVSTRPVSVWAIRSNDDGIPVLVAKCHLRKATRYFRVDRIQAVANFDGVIIEPIEAFLQETFGISWSGMPIAARDKQRDWKKIRRICKDCGTQLLVAVAIADGEIIPDELGEILDLVHRFCRMANVEVSPSDAIALKNYILRMRPTKETVDNSIDEMMERRVETMMATLEACIRVMDADGIRHEAEARLIRRISDQLSGGLN